MSDTLYIKANQKIKVSKTSLTVGDVGQLWCSSASVLAECKALHYKCLKEKQSTGNIIEITEIVQRNYPGVTVVNEGEKDFVFEVTQKPVKVFEIIKVSFAAATAFFGAAFAIMTFNADVNVEKVFRQIHQLLTGSERGSITFLEIGYSAGLFIGIMLFYNHFKKNRKKTDPTLLEVEMNKYEKDSCDAIINQNSNESENTKNGI